MKTIYFCLWSAILTTPPFSQFSSAAPFDSHSLEQAQEEASKLTATASSIGSDQDKAYVLKAQFETACFPYKPLNTWEGKFAIRRLPALWRFEALQQKMNRMDHPANLGDLQLWLDLSDLRKEFSEAERDLHRVDDGIEQESTEKKIKLRMKVSELTIRNLALGIDYDVDDDSPCSAGVPL